MKIYECGYCDHRDEADSMRGHLLSAHDINAFDEALWRHAEEAKGKSEQQLDTGGDDMTLEEFMDEHEDVDTEAVVDGSDSIYESFKKWLKNKFN